jgi:hypothetical protein
MSENVGASTSRNPKGLHGLYGDNFTLPPTLLNYFNFEISAAVNQMSLTDMALPTPADNISPYFDNVQYPTS